MSVVFKSFLQIVFLYRFLSRKNKDNFFFFFFFFYCWWHLSITTHTKKSHIFLYKKRVGTFLHTTLTHSNYSTLISLCIFSSSQHFLLKRVFWVIVEENICIYNLSISMKIKNIFP